MTDAPFRLCCGERHWTVACPDGRVMCCLCYERFPIDELDRDANDPSKRWDVCIPCADADRAAVIARDGTERSPLPRPQPPAPTR